MELQQGSLRTRRKTRRQNKKGGGLIYDIVKQRNGGESSVIVSDASSVCRKFKGYRITKINHTDVTGDNIEGLIIRSMGDDASVTFAPPRYVRANTILTIKVPNDNYFVEVNDGRATRKLTPQKSDVIEYTVPITNSVVTFQLVRKAKWRKSEKKGSEPFTLEVCSDLKDIHDALSYLRECEHKYDGNMLIPAVKRYQTAITELLLKYGADANQKDAKNWTAIMHAASTNQVYIAKKLIENGATMSADDWKKVLKVNPKDMSEDMKELIKEKFGLASKRRRLALGEFSVSTLLRIAASLLLMIYLAYELKRRLTSKRQPVDTDLEADMESGLALE